MLNLKADTALIENQQSVTVNKVKANTRQKKERKVPKTPCWYCGDFHYARFCPYKSHKCGDCLKTGHKEGYCTRNSNNKTYTTNGTQQQNNTSATQKKRKQQYKQLVQSNGIFVTNQVQFQRKYINVLINGVPIRLQFDTGSDITIISKHTFDTLNIEETEAVDRSARSETGELPLTSQFTCSVSFQGDEKSLTCRVSPISDLNVMGLDWMDAFNLKDQSINSVCNQVQNFQGSVDKSAIKTRSAQLKLSFPDVFDGKMGLCNKTKAILQTKPNVQPVFRPKRPVAYAMQQLVETELQRLQDCEIISSVTYSDWAAPIVVIKKQLAAYEYAQIFQLD